MKRLIAWLQLVPKIIGAILEIESSIPFGKLGLQKLQLLLSAIRLVWDTEKEIREVFPWASLESLIKSAATAFVEILKQMGIMKSQPPVPTDNPSTAPVI